MSPSFNACPNVRLGVGQDEKQFSLGAMYKLLDDCEKRTSHMSWREVWEIQATERV